MNEIKTKNKSQKRLLIENIVSLSLLQWVNYLVPLLLIPFLVRSLGIEVFGLVMFAQSVSTIFIIFSEFCTTFLEFFNNSISICFSLNLPLDLE